MQKGECKHTDRIVTLCHAYSDTIPKTEIHKKSRPRMHGNDFSNLLYNNLLYLTYTLPNS